MINNHSLIVLIFAGVAFLLLGVNIASENLQKIAANRIREMLVKINNKTYLGVMAGIAITFLIQSSGAVTSMIVGLGNAGVVTLPQVMGIILGAGIGTTFTVQLLSFKISELGLAIFAVCFAVQFLSSRPLISRWMRVGMGFGLMFWGLEVISIGSQELSQLDFFLSAIDYLRANPFFMLIIVALFTAVVQSSAAVIGIAMSFANAGFLSSQDAFYWVYGANIGTTAVALLASSGANYIGKQVAWAHCLHKVSMVSLLYFLTPFLSSYFESDSPQRNVATIHLFFNLAAVVIFYPFVQPGVKIIESWIRPGPQEKDFSVKYLDRVNFESPTICVAHAEREIMRMGDIVISMMKDCLNLFRMESAELVKDIRAKDNKVDLLNREISLFITKYMDAADNALHKQMIHLVSLAADLESAADVIDNSLIDLAQKKHRLKVEFSEEGWRELEKIHNEALEIAQISMSCFQLQSRDLAQQVILRKREIRKLEQYLRESHIERLVKGRMDSINTSSIHMDLLSDIRRIVGLFSNHVYSLAKGDKDKFVITKRG